MPFDQSAQQRLVADIRVAQPSIAVGGKRGVGPGLLGFVLHFLEAHHRRVAALVERAVLVVDEGDAAAHAGGEIAAGAAEHDDRAAGHVLAAVIAGAFDDGRGAGIAHAKALAGDAAKIRLAGDRAVHHRIADDDVLVGLRRTLGIRIDDDAAARQALADVVVGRSLQLEADAAREECAEALAGGALERDMDRVLGQARMPVAPRDDAGQHRADRAVRVADLVLEAHRRLPLDRSRRSRDQLVVERAIEPVVLLFAMEARDFRRHRRLIEDAREVQAPRLPVIDAGAGVEQIRAADQLLEAADAELGHDARALRRRRRT